MVVHRGSPEMNENMLFNLVCPPSLRVDIGTPKGAQTLAQIR